MSDPEVIVIGAGAAGLAAASELSAAGVRVLVLEARERLGGRILTLREPGSAVPLELGAEFIHGRPKLSFEWLERGGLHAVDAVRTHRTLSNGRFRDRESSYGKVLRALRRTLEDSREETLVQFLGRSRLSEAAKRYATMMAEGFDAADPARVSARSLAKEWLGEAAADSPTFRPLEGYDRLIDTLSRTLDPARVRVQLRSVVQSVRWSRGAAVVQGRYLEDAFHVRSPRVLITVPLGVLQARAGEPGAICFDPPLTQKAAALRGVASGGVLKVILRFRSAFWESLQDGALRSTSFFHVPEQDFPTFWNLLPLRSAHLIAWAGGPRVQRIPPGTDAIARRAVECVQQGFRGAGNLWSQLEQATTHDWQRDPFARGAYSYQVAGAPRARELLARPLLSTLYFAGEATDTDQAGTVAGALLSGRRAARLILRRCDV